MAYLKQLPTIPSGTTLFDVMAWDSPPQIGGKQWNIGSIQMTGPLITSKWGDRELFFRHQKLDEDLKLRSNWRPYLEQFKGLFMNLMGWATKPVLKCPYSHLH